MQGSTRALPADSGSPGTGGAATGASPPPPPAPPPTSSCICTATSCRCGCRAATELVRGKQVSYIAPPGMVRAAPEMLGAERGVGGGGGNGGQ